MFEPIPTVAEVLDKLAAFGSPRQIADHLEQQGVRGRCGEAARCPIARHIMQVTGLLVTVVPGSGDGGGWCRANGSDRTVVLPEVVSGFVHGFDVGSYPALIERVSR